MLTDPPDHQPAPDPTFAYDVFISYSSKDKVWARGPLLERLEAQGLRVCIDFRDFRPGVPSTEEMERAVLTSRFTLIVLTPQYLTSGWTKFERLMRQTLDADAQEYRLIPLLKEPCTPPLSLSYLTHVDFTNPQYETLAWHRLLSALQPARVTAHVTEIPLSTVLRPTPLPPGSRMQFSPNLLFVGRDQELLALAEALKAGETAAIGQVEITAATGLGGIGKTQLAAEFVHRYGQYFDGGVFWISFADPESVPAEVAACGGLDGMQLRPDFEQLSLDTQVQLVLAEWRSQTPRLLVFDNCEDEALLNQWRPKYGGCRVLVTSRRAEWDTALGVRAIPLGVLPRPKSIALLRAFRRDLSEDNADLDAIAAELGDLPLALHLAGSFLKRYQRDMTAAEYLDDLRASTGLAHESLEGAGISPTQHDLSIARTFRLSYDRLDEAILADSLALSMLARAAYFAPGESIPRYLLRATVNLPSDERKANRRMSESVRRLVDLGLLEEEVEGAVRVHRLVAAFVRTITSDSTAQTAVEQTMRSVVSELNARGYPAPLLVLQSHLRAITDAALDHENERTASLTHELGYYLAMIGAYQEAQNYYERSLAIRQRVLGLDNNAVAASLNNLALVLQEQGHYSEAQNYYEQALMIVERVLGHDHPTTATCLNNLGGTLQPQGRYNEAQDCYEQGFAIRKRVLGPDHPETVNSLNNLGFVLQAQGQYVAAQDYHQQALAIRQRVLGDDHPLTAASLNNLGSVLQAQGQYAAAQGYHEQALAIRKRVLGPGHPETANSLNNLGTLFHAQGRYSEAQSYFEQALMIVERVLGLEHPHTHTVQQNLARLMNQHHES